MYQTYQRRKLHFSSAPNMSDTKFYTGDIVYSTQKKLQGIPLTIEEPHGKKSYVVSHGDPIEKIVCRTRTLQTNADVKPPKDMKQDKVTPPCVKIVAVPSAPVKDKKNKEESENVSPLSSHKERVKVDSKGKRVKRRLVSEEFEASLDQRLKEVREDLHEFIDTRIQLEKQCLVKIMDTKKKAAVKELTENLSKSKL